MNPPPVVMVHGAFCGGWVFEDFAEPFKAAGCQVTAPDLPGHAPGAAPESAAGRSMGDYAAHVARLASRLDSPPVLIGHSLGGLVCLLAAARAPTAGVVLLAPSAPWGVSGSTMEEAVSALSLYGLGAYWAQAVEPDYSTFHRYTADRLGRPEREALFARMRPESGRALFETLNWWLDPFMTTMVQPSRIAAPVLAIAGGRDVIHPPATVRETARRVGARLEVAQEMSHWLLGEPEWPQVAGLCLEWLAGIRAPMAAE